MEGGMSLLIGKERLSLRVGEEGKNFLNEH